MTYSHPSHALILVWSEHWDELALAYLLMRDQSALHFAHVPTKNLVNDNYDYLFK